MKSLERREQAYNMFYHQRLFQKISPFQSEIKEFLWKIFLKNDFCNHVLRIQILSFQGKKIKIEPNNQVEHYAYALHPKSKRYFK